MVSPCMCVCVLSGSGAGPGAFNQSQQPPAGATPPSHQPVMGLAQAQANNSNNKTGTYSSMSVNESSLPEDLQRLMDDWAHEVLIVTQRPYSSSLSISRQQLWDQVVPRTHGQLTGASDVSFHASYVPVCVFKRPCGCKKLKNI